MAIQRHWLGADWPDCQQHNRSEQLGVEGRVTAFSAWTFNSTLSPSAVNGTISGRITTSDGKPVEGAVVRIEWRTITQADYRQIRAATGSKTWMLAPSTPLRRLARTTSSARSIAHSVR